MIRASSALGATPTRMMTGKTCWIISDGKAGHEAQCIGVAEALGADFEIKRVTPSGLWKLLSPWGPVSPFEHFGKATSSFKPPWPGLALATGRLTTPYIRTLKRHARQQTYTVVLLDPKTGPRTADLFWIPAHDHRRGSNVITTLLPPHRHSPQSLELLRRTAPPFAVTGDRPNVVVLLGGPNGDYSYSDRSIARLCGALSSLRRFEANLLITASRRTPGKLIGAVRETLRSTDHYFWDGCGENPLPHFYARGDVFVVPADSINMTAEPCATGRPIYVFHPDGGSPKFSRFHKALEACGAARPMPASFSRLETWSYRPMFAAADIAGEIERRWSKRRSSS